MTHLKSMIREIHIDNIFCTFANNRDIIKENMFRKKQLQDLFSVFIPKKTDRDKLESLQNSPEYKELQKEIERTGKKIEQLTQKLSKVRVQLDKDIKFLNKQGCPANMSMDTDTFCKTINKWYENKYHEKLDAPTAKLIKKWSF